MGFCCSKSHQPLVSTRSSGIMTWGTISAVLLLSTICILWSFSLCCCMTANPVTAGTPASVLSIKHVDQNKSGAHTGLEQTTSPGLDTAKLLSCLPPQYLLSVNLKIYTPCRYSPDLYRPCKVSRWKKWHQFPLITGSHAVNRWY